jgi:hypothetical protein
VFPVADDFYIREPLKPGMCGVDVAYLQEGLRLVGYDVPGDGVFDARTSAAWRELQIDNHLSTYEQWQDRSASDLAQYGKSVEDNLRGRFPDEESLQRRLEAESPWLFETKEKYERFLRSEPDPFGPAIVDGNAVWDEINASSERRAKERLPTDYKPGDPYPPETEALLQASNDWYFRHLTGSDENWTFPIKATEIAPPGSGPHCPMSDAGGGPSITDLALYDEIRKKLPTEIGNDRAAEATLRAMQDGIKTPGQLQDVIIANDRIFVVGNIPGYRGVVDLNQPSLSSTDIQTQFAAFEQQQQTERDQPQQVRGALSLS